MKVHNFLPTFIQCMKRWENPPGLDDFVESYYRPMEPLVGVVFDDLAKRIGGNLHSAIEDLNWKKYRTDVLTLDPQFEEDRVRRQIGAVEELFGFRLEGDAILWGSFQCMDGYARFDRGSHRVFLGVDENHGPGKYLDVLISHELTHVARESRAEVWKGWGLNPAMTHDEFSENQPVIEHLIGEGFSCAVSEILVGGVEPWNYVYQTEASLARVLKHASSVNEVIHREIQAGSDGDWSRLYNPAGYRPNLPVFTHYVWAWQWAKQLLQDHAQGDPRKIVGVCSKEFVEHALAFELRNLA